MTQIKHAELNGTEMWVWYTDKPTLQRLYKTDVEYFDAMGKMDERQTNQ